MFSEYSFGSQTKQEIAAKKVAEEILLDEGAVKMQAKLAAVKDEKRAEALKLAQELKQIQMERQFLNADKVRFLPCICVLSCANFITK
jgi:cupin superfamily acireductone dioxygenase involved in methionine salvage